MIMEITGILTFLAFIVIYVTWFSYVDHLETKTRRIIKKFVVESPAMHYDLCAPWKGKVKEYKVYIHEAESMLSLGQGHEITLAGYSLREALTQRYLALKSQNETARFQPIALMGIKPLTDAQ